MNQEKLHDQLNQEARERILENKDGKKEEKRKKTNISYKTSLGLRIDNKR